MCLSITKPLGLPRSHPRKVGSEGPCGPRLSVLPGRGAQDAFGKLQVVMEAFERLTGIFLRSCGQDVLEDRVAWDLVLLCF